MYRHRLASLFGLLVIFFFALLATLDQAAALKRTNTVSQGQADAGSGSSNQEPRVSLSLSTDPNVVTPGEKFNLNLELVNHSNSSISPFVMVKIPDSVSPEIAQLPPGVMYDFQQESYSWQPIVESSGDRTTISLPLKVNLASMEQPEQIITARLAAPGIDLHTSTIIWIGVLPSASITFDPPQVSVGQPIKMRGLLSGPGPLKQEWDLGDGRIVEAQDPAVVFPFSGTYVITLKASNPLGYTTVQAAVSVIDQPIAHFLVEDTTVAAGQEITLINQSGGAQPISYKWDFNDGFGSQGENPQHSYSETGSYLIRLEVSNEFGSSESYSQIVVGSPPVADAVIPVQGTAGQVVELMAFFDDSLSEVLWDMGDGRTTSGTERRHVYWAAGDYLIQMTATNEFGSTTVSNWIQIGPGNLYLYMPLSVSDSSLDYGSFSGPIEVTGPTSTPSPAVEEQLEGIDFPDSAGPADKLLAYINQARLKNNMRPLRYVYELSVAAQRHTDDMSTSSVLGHTGSDQSTPALRIQESSYPGGYGGEATAWGMEDPIEPVRFWLNSPGHRAILLHPAVSDVGVGFTLNYNSANIWYWTAEFGSLSLPQIVVRPTAPPVNTDLGDDSPGSSGDDHIGDAAILLLGPPQNSQFDLNPENSLYFTWSWKELLVEGQFFNLVIGPSGTNGISTGSAATPYSGSQYQLKVKAEDFAGGPGNYLWQVNLVGTGGEIIKQSDVWPLVINSKVGSGTEPTASATPIVTVDPTRASEPPSQPTPLPLSTPLPPTQP